MTAAYLVLIAFSVGRPKDNSRILAPSAAGGATAETIDALAARYELRTLKDQRLGRIC